MTMTTLTDHSTRRLSDRLARRAGTFDESIWTGIFTQFGKHADPVYFGDGAPAPEMIPVGRLREGSALAWDDAPDCLKYGDQQGYAPLRELVAQRIGRRGIDIGGDDVLITSGSTQALDLACRAFLEPGDAVIVESPTFLGALEILQTYEVEIIGVSLDADGMRMDELEAALAANPGVKAIYTIPTFHNPAGVTMSRERRERLVELARAHNVAVLEDDPYGELQYSGELLPPLRALDDAVIHLGTFSKTIAPGIRCGYGIAPPEVMEAMLAIREVTDISNDRVTMRTVYHTAVDFLDDHMGKANTLYRLRRDVMLAALEAHMPEGVTWSQPDGGFFIWVRLPEGVRSDVLFDSGAEHGVIVFPGEWFYEKRDVFTHVRLSFSTVAEDRIWLGAERLGAAVRELMG